MARQKIYKKPPVITGTTIFTDSEMKVINEIFEALAGEKPKTKKKVKKLKCPVCKSTDILDASVYQTNGIYGPGFSRWKTFDARCCNTCGVFFKPVKGNTDEENE